MKHASLPHVPRRGGCHKLPYDSRLTAAHARRQAGKKSFESHLQKNISARARARSIHHAFDHFLIAAAALVPALAQADAIKVGIANDISGPFSALGAEARDGFNLAIKQLGGKLGGQPAEFLQTDMGGNPDQARQLVTRYLQREKVDFFTGPIGSNVALAVGPALFAAKVPYLSNNPPQPVRRRPVQSVLVRHLVPERRLPRGRRQGRGRQRLQEDVHHGPDYPAGKDALNGFKRGYKAAPGDEVYTKLGQIDYAAELAQIRAAAGRGLHLPARRHGHQFRQAVRVCRPVAEYQADRPGFGR